MLFKQNTGNHEFSGFLDWYIYLSLVIKTSKSDQGVLYSMGHVRFITVETGGGIYNV